MILHFWSASWLTLQVSEIQSQRTDIIVVRNPSIPDGEALGMEYNANLNKSSSRFECSIISRFIGDLSKASLTHLVTIEWFLFSVAAQQLPIILGNIESYSKILGGVGIFSASYSAYNSVYLPLTKFVLIVLDMRPKREITRPSLWSKKWWNFSI